MRVQNNTINIYNNKTSTLGLTSIPAPFKACPNQVMAASAFSPKTNFARNIAAKGLVKFYKWLGGYDYRADKDLAKLLARNDISFKKLLLYIHSGGMHFAELLKVKSIDEISAKDRKSLLKKIVKDDMVVFDLNRYVFPGIQDIIPLKFYPKKIEKSLFADFPLLPQNETDYALLLEKLVDSVGIKNDKLPHQKIEQFNAVLTNLTSALVKLPDEDFLQAKNLKELKEIFTFIPELKSTAGRKQHGAHDYDVLTHSLKVLKNIGKDEGFKSLNESDKKIMMLAALMHDITKKEGVVDTSHPLDSSLETYFIAKKFDLSEEEETKLYKLIKNHEWLKYVNVASKDRRNYRMMHISWEFMKDNLFDMALMFTHADLRAVKADGSFHDSTVGKSRIKLNGKVRSFGEAADIYAREIKNKINYLQQTQPLIPMTQFPTASKISQAVNVIHQDGSTDIKGVYIDKDGLVILKFNEVEDWEKIGFPKGSTTKGIKVKLDKNREVETGNIKFLAHGLAFENQLARFCAFRLPDSNAVLSVSYAERPETKYRFFRPQGLLGTTDTFNILGGGQYDAGSGFKKNLRNFRYLLEYTARKICRPFVSEKIKKATGMSSEEYQNFVLKYQNKPYTENFPEDVRNKMIQTLGAMKSTTRRGMREYNEFYATQFKPMAAYAYNMENSKIENPIEFLNRDDVHKKEKNSGTDWGLVRSVKDRTSFLRTYALKHDMPFVILG